MNWRRILVGSWSWKRLPLSIGVVYGTLAVFACHFADRLIFLPPRPGYDAGSGQLVFLPTDRGESIAAVHLPARPGMPTLLYSHGNAEDLGGVLPLVRSWHAEGLGILAYDYPGYGHSTGKPTEDSCERAIQAAWDHLTGPAGLDPSSIVLVGRSVGGGPAVWLATRRNPAGLVLISPFTSIYRVRLPAPIFPGDRFPNLERIARIDLPLLVIHGENDAAIPASHGRRLHDAHPGPDKQWVAVPAAGHNDLFHVAGPEIHRRVSQFARRVAGNPTR